LKPNDEDYHKNYQNGLVACGFLGGFKDEKNDT